jgi:hypothetical protein
VDEFDTDVVTVALDRYEVAQLADSRVSGSAL